ncbi:MAG: hypothetical protein HC819_15510 [Cyclobacteriaceae bacterium]|nr:hypothetical protein [Cyclobacteriaceae bacterium]
MNVEYSKNFQKAYRKQSGKMQKSVANSIREVKEAKTIESLTDCEKLIGYSRSYRLRIGSLRAFFIFHVDGEKVCFEYLVPRGEAYSKKTLSALREKD